MSNRFVKPKVFPGVGASPSSASAKRVEAGLDSTPGRAGQPRAGSGERSSTSEG
jgi:hypothetical protein